MALSPRSKVLTIGPGAVITKDIFVDVHEALGDSQFHVTDANCALIYLNK